jgi:predicted TPR repeat methyltransferase
LYPLQIAYLTGVESMDDPARLAEAIGLYEAALALEPTWEVGWINLAGLYERAGRIDDALAALERAQTINPRSAAGWNLKRLSGDSRAQASSAASLGRPWTDRHFENVLYGRSADFQLLPGLTPPGA